MKKKYMKPWFEEPEYTVFDVLTLSNGGEAQEKDLEEIDLDE